MPVGAKGEKAPALAPLETITVIKKALMPALPATAIAKGASRATAHHCAGFCGHGVMQSPAVGRLMAELILDSTCRYDLAELKADRFFDLPEFAHRARVEASCADAYAGCYSRVEREVATLAPQCPPHQSPPGSVER